jgi:hypothetical protein
VIVAVVAVVPMIIRGMREVAIEYLLLIRRQHAANLA